MRLILYVYFVSLFFLTNLKLKKKTPCLTNSFLVAKLPRKQKKKNIFKHNAIRNKSTIRRNLCDDWICIRIVCTREYSTSFHDRPHPFYLLLCGSTPRVLGELLPP